VAASGRWCLPGVGIEVNRKRIERIMRQAGLQGIYRRTGTSLFVRTSGSAGLSNRVLPQLSPGAGDRMCWGCEGLLSLFDGFPKSDILLIVPRGRGPR
jgi:hypothetical protein